MAKEKRPDGPQWLEHTEVIDDLKWIKGIGQLPAEYMIVGERPGNEEVTTGNLFTGPAGLEILFPTMDKAGFQYLKEGVASCKHVAARAEDYAIYMTNAVKFCPPAKRAVNASDLKVCRPCLEEEMKRCAPKVIVCLGAKSLTAVMGRGHNLSDYRGSFVKHPTLPDTEVFTTYNPAFILRNPERQVDYDRDWKLLTDRQLGREVERDTMNFMVLQSVAQIRAFKQHLFDTYPNPFLMIDCEWDGATWMSPDRYIRTVQLGFELGQAVVIEFFDEGVVPEGESWTHDCRGNVMDDHDAAWAEIKLILEDERVDIGGQNVIADGEWLLSYDIDVRSRVVYDTMLAEHDICETGPFALEDLTIKYTNIGHYELPVKEWVKEHKKICKHGYGPVPRDLLLPYSAWDVDAPRRIAIKQAPELQQFREPRGKYPSLWETDMDTQHTLYEIERTGMLIDKERLAHLTKDYTEVLTQLASRAKLMAHNEGVVDFNFRSQPQVASLLFDNLGLTPIKTTKGKAWTDHMQNQPREAQALYSPCTDMNTLEILQEKHPFVKVMADIRRVDQARKTWLRDPSPDFDEATSGGGIIAKIWVDGRIHPRFSQLAETGRFKTSKPNCQNWPKRAEGYIWKIFETFGKERPDQIRTIVIPKPGHFLMEADFVQAELFVLAALSGDEVMWGTLTTPGKDMHDMTAISSFHLSVLGPDGNPMPEDYLLTLAKDDMAAFEKLQKQLMYLDLQGERMSRADFKNTIRVSAKNLNFGIPYGRGSMDIARQVKGETGSTQSLDILQAEIDTMMEVWKEQTFVDAWGYMCSCADAVTKTGLLTNPWGRCRRFTVGNSREGVAGMQRQAQNFPIQSTVADTCMVAMYLIKRYREEHNLHFRIVNQIHDAVMVEVPENEIEETKVMFQETMGKIDIPIPDRDPLRLGIDIDVMTRWGEKV